MSSRIINNLKDIQHCSYLELGVGDRSNFDFILAEQKTSVDTNGSASYTGTTDEYFATLTKESMFDIIFIDASHTYQSVLTDFNNSVDHCNRWLLLHDVIPPNDWFAGPDYCSDCYKVLYHILKYENFFVYPMDNNYGLTLIKMPANKIYPSEETANLEYLKFKEFISTVKLYNDSEIIKILRKE